MNRKLLILYILLLSIVSSLQAQTVSYQWTAPTCAAPPNGSLEYQVKGATGTLRYVLINSVTSIPVIVDQKDSSCVFNGLSPNIKYITYVQDSASSFLLTDVLEAVLVQEPYTADIVKIQGSGCTGQAVGELEVDIEGGVAPYTITWNDSGLGGGYANDTLIKNLGPDSYTVAIEDAIGCKISDGPFALENEDIKASVSINSHVTCKTEPEGSASVSSVRGKNGVTYFWDDGTVGTTNTTIYAGNRFVAAVDGIGCRDTTYFNISEPATKMELSLVSKGDSECKGMALGDATVSSVLGNAPINYAWSDGGIGLSRNDLAAANYQVIATDIIGCKDTVNFVINEPVFGVVGSLDAFSLPTCYGYGDGTATISASGGNPGYTVLWDDGNTNFVRNNLVSKNYNIVFTDQDGCEAQMYFTLLQPDPVVPEIVALDNSPALTTVPCYKDCGIDVKVNTTGGTLPLASWVWDNGLPAGNTASLCAGTYNVTVTDANGCSGVGTHTITQPDSIDLQLFVSTPIPCYNTTGVVSSNVIGGTAPYNFAWSTGSNLPNSQAATTGMHTVQMTDNNGCVAIDSLLLSQPDSIELAFTLNGLLCEDVTLGSATASAIGGTEAGTYDFLWSSGQNTPTNSNLQQAIYTVTVTDDNGCTNSDDLDLSTVNGFAVNFTSSKISCNGRTDGAITATAINGIAPYSFLWSDGETNPIRTGLSVGWYKITITDDIGCEVVDSMYLDVVSPMYSILSGTTKTSCNTAEGSAFIDMTGGTQPYDILWSNGATADSIVNLAVNFYSVLVTDDNGCTYNETLFVDDTSTLSVSITSNDTKINCAGAGHGTAVATGYKGTSPYVFTWSHGFVGDTSKNMTAGFYSVTVSDANMCKSTDTIRFTEENVLQALITDSSMVSCNGLSNGYAVSSAIGGASPYSVLWSNGKTSNLISNLTAATYTVSITDKAGCVESRDIIITEPSIITATFENTDGISCGDKCDGNSRVIPSGGTAPYTFLWGSGETDSTASFLCGGLNYITITDSLLCSHLDSVEIVDTMPRIGLTRFEIQSTCGVADGELAVTPFGGIPNYSYLWDNGGTDSLIQNVRARVYGLTVTDVAGCTLDTVLVLDDVSPITLDMVRQPITFCNPCNESFLADAQNSAAPPYNYTWSNGDNTSISDSLCVGFYWATVEDQAQCVRSSVFDVQAVNLQVDLVSKTDVLCNGANSGVIEVIASGGVSSNYTYLWSNSDNGASINSLAGGDYTVTVTEDLSVCPITQTYSISEGDPLQIFFISDQTSYCEDSSGIMHVEVLGGQIPYSYLWETGDADSVLDNAWPEYISIDVTDANSCVTTDSAKVNDVSDFILVEKSRYLISCLGDTDGKLEVGLINGYSPFTYEWAHDPAIDTSIAEALAPGNYKVTVTDSKNCKVPYNFAPLNDADTMKISFEEPDPIFCAKGFGSIKAVVDGGHPNYIYAWSSGGTPLPGTSEITSNKTAGDYSVYVIDSRNCVSEQFDYTLKDPAPITAEYTVVKTGCGSLANTGEIHIDTIYGPNPPYRFQWPGINEPKQWYLGSSDTVRVGLPAGEYFITISDSLELCTAVPKKLYTTPYTVTSIDSVITHTKCNFYTQQQVDDVLPEGKIEIVELTTGEGTYSSFGDFTFAWEDDYSQTGNVASHLQVGDHYVNITGNNKCVSRVHAGTIQARVNLFPDIETVENATRLRTEICLGDSIELRAKAYETFKFSYSPSITTRNYIWGTRSQNKQANFSNLTSTTAWAAPQTTYFTDSALVFLQYEFDGCTSSETDFTISHFDSIGFALDMFDSNDMYLEGDSNFVIQDMPFSIMPVIEPWYINKDVGVDGFVSVNWTSKNPQRTGVGQLNDTVVNETSYLQSNNYGLHLTARIPSYYFAEAITTKGCREYDKVFMNVFSDGFVPTGITPNGDGDNDTWVIPYLYSCPDASVKIFNRWGVKIYENEGAYYKNPWNGTNNNGKLMPLGTYYFMIEYNDENNTTPHAGPITVLY